MLRFISDEENIKLSTYQSDLLQDCCWSGSVCFVFFIVWMEASRRLLKITVAYEGRWLGCDHSSKVQETLCIIHKQVHHSSNGTAVNVRLKIGCCKCYPEMIPPIIHLLITTDCDVKQQASLSVILIRLSLRQGYCTDSLKNVSFKRIYHQM